MYSVRTINAMTEVQFMENFAGIYEKSPWVVTAVIGKLPVQNAAELVAVFRQSVEEAGTEKQDALIRAHPDLGGKLAREGQLTVDSAREQSRLGLDQLDDESFATFNALNQAYLERFHFPFIVCVGLLESRDQILAAFRTRLHHSLDQERQEALKQIHWIAHLRLSALVEGIPPL